MPTSLYQAMVIRPESSGILNARMMTEIPVDEQQITKRKLRRSDAEGAAEIFTTLE